MKRRGRSRAQAKRSGRTTGSAAAPLRAPKIRRPEPSVAPERSSAIAAKALPLLLIGAGLAAYHSSFAGTFLLDDKPRILNNPQIRQLWPPWTAMAHNSRPLVQLSLAVNYALGGLNPWGYHAFNLAVHLLAGLVLFGIVRRMLESSKLRPRYGRAAPWLAGAVAIVWTVHPLQTESVTYIIQRAESLMGLFFLLALYCSIRGASSPHPRPWYLAAIITCWLGMGSKEVMVSAPLVMLLYDRVFLSDSFTEIFRRRWGLYLGLAAAWLVLGVLLAASRGEEQTMLVTNLTPWRYALTQFGVIVHYLRLSVWPGPLVLDYAWPLTETVSSVVPGAAVVLALLGGTALALHRQAWVGFWGAWFFLILAPTSSIFPIADVAFEHRMYLPLATVVVLVVVGGHEALEYVFRRLPAPDARLRWLELGLATAAILALASATARRNEDYRSDFVMWSDIVAKRPLNPRAHYNWGNVLYRQGKVNEAISHFSEVLRLKPDYADAHVYLGVALGGQGQLNEAIAHFSEALRLRPNSAEARYNLGAALFRQGRLEEAITHLSESVRLNPSSATAHYDLGEALASQGQLEEATVHYSTALRIDPNHAESHNALGSALARQGKLEEAAAHYSAALRINPNYSEARRNLRAAQTSLQRAKEKP